MSTASRPRLNRITGPSVQPVSVADAKKQLEIAPDDTAHDDHLEELIESAREQFEFITKTITVPQVFELLLDNFPTDRIIRLPIRPVTSLVSVVYSDEGVTSTLATSVADLDRKKRNLALKYDQDWPTIAGNHDAVVITVNAGYPQGTVPRSMKRVMLEEIANRFEFREQEGSSKRDDCYERQIKKFIPGHYVT